MTKVVRRSNGKKDDLLVRLAKKLSTEEGKQQVKLTLKPEIFTDLYETPLKGDIANNSTNPVYQHYLGLIPLNIAQEMRNLPAVHYVTSIPSVQTLPTSSQLQIQNTAEPIIP